MADMMTFPNTVEEFMEKYKITDTENVYTNGAEMVPIFRMEQWFDHLPSAQPFHNITMSEVLAYIDGMPEDVWQEFTACLECRGWNLERRTAKWCGGEFA